MGSDVGAWEGKAVTRGGGVGLLITLSGGGDAMGVLTPQALSASTPARAAINRSLKYCVREE